MAATLPLASGDTLVVRQSSGNPASAPSNNPTSAAPAAAAPAPGPAPAQPPQQSAPAALGEPPPRSAPTEPVHSAPAASREAEQWRSAPAAEAGASGAAASWGDLRSAVRRMECMSSSTSTGGDSAYVQLFGLYRLLLGGVQQHGKGGTCG